MAASNLLAVAMALAMAGGVSAPAATPPEPAPSTAAARLFVFLYRPGPAWREGVPMRQQGLGPHAEDFRQLLDQGRVFAAGGFADGDGGMAIVLAAGRDEADALLARDPAVASSIFAGTVEEWRPRFRTDRPLPPPVAD